MNLFRFMMDLLDEPKKVEETEDKRLANPFAPFHPVLNPYITDMKPTNNNSFEFPTQPSPFSDPNSLFSKLEEIDKRKATELGKTRAVNEAVKPLVNELENLKKQAHEDALKDREEEELDLVKEDLESNVSGIDDLPKEIREKLETESSDDTFLKNSKMPQAITDAMMNATQKPTEYVPELKGGAISYAPKTDGQNTENNTSEIKE